MNARPATLETRLDAARGRAAEYLELTKPRVTAMVLVTTLAGYYLGAAGAFDAVVALNLLIGTALASGGTLALNQYMERDTDAMMDRTRLRPIPDKRIEPTDALWFAALTTGAGLGYLVLTVNWLSAAVTAGIAISYLFAYTPLKRISWSCNMLVQFPEPCRRSRDGPPPKEALVWSRGCCSGSCFCGNCRIRFRSRRSIALITSVRGYG